MKKFQQGFTLIELMIVVAIIGILAAIAIPQYNDYTARSQASECFSLLDGLKTPMQEAFAQDGSWVIPAGSVIAGKYVSSIVGNGIASSGGNLICSYKNSSINVKLIGDTVGLRYIAQNASAQGGPWTCASSLDPEIAPKACTASAF